MTAGSDLLRLASDQVDRLAALVTACEVESLAAAFDDAAQRVRDEDAYRLRSLARGVVD